MIPFEKVYDATEKAFNNDEIYELLTGKKGYDVPLLGVSIDIPTDWGAIVEDGIYQLYQNEKNKMIIEEYQKALLKMIIEEYQKALLKMINNDDDTEVWMAAYIMYIQLEDQVKNKAPFNIDNNVLLKFKQAIVDNRYKLEHNQKYVGIGYPNGLMGDVERLDRNLLRHASVSLVN